MATSYRRFFVLSIFFLCFSFCLFSQQEPRKDKQFITADDIDYLEKLTKEVVDSSRILPGQELPASIKSYGPNNMGITLIKPGGRDSYPAFWIRDYAMSLESGFISKKEQLDILLFVASKQANNSWWTKSGSFVPFGSIPDHIRFDNGAPIYFPGTYRYDEQGDTLWKMPPYGDQFFFIHMAYCYLQISNDFSVLKDKVNNISLIDRLEISFQVVPTNWSNQLVHVNSSQVTCDFGFRDLITITGDVCFGSVLKYRAALELSEIFKILNNKEKSAYYKNIGIKIKVSIGKIFANDQGMLLASTGISNQPDVWATAFAIYVDALEEGTKANACIALTNAFKNGTLATEGNIRHILTCDDYSVTSAWEKSLISRNKYQNGAYWGTPTGWVCYAIAQHDTVQAQILAKEYINHLRKTDFRLNKQLNGGPYECFYPADGYYKNPVYMTSVTCPYAAFKLLNSE